MFIINVNAMLKNIQGLSFKGKLIAETELI